MLTFQSFHRSNHSLSFATLYEINHHFIIAGLELKLRTVAGLLTARDHLHASLKPILLVRQYRGTIIIITITITITITIITITITIMITITIIITITITITIMIISKYVNYQKITLLGTSHILRKTLSIKYASASFSPYALGMEPSYTFASSAFFLQGPIRLPILSLDSEDLKSIRTCSV